MEIQRVILNNVGLFENLELDLAPTLENPSHITVLVGNNGAGKSLILAALATSLSWFVARLGSKQGSGNPISEDTILNGANFARIQIKITDSYGGADPSNSSESNEFEWTLAKTRKGRTVQYKSHLNDCTRLTDRYRESLTHNDKTSLPLIAFYSVERVVLDIPLKIRTKHNFLQLDGYDNSFSHGVDFRRFFEWFREREDTENESGISEEVLNKVKPLLENNQEALKQLEQLSDSAKDPQLTAVRTAIRRFMPEMDNLRVRRKPRLYMAIDKNGETLNVAQLSQGEKSLMALVGDIARRLAMLNPALENPLEGDGIVLIDEVDLHLHPSWQRNLCDRLIETFPNCQFVLTTHSPLVISDSQNLLVYTLNKGEVQGLPSQYGQDANMVLLEVMDTSFRNESIEIELNNLLDAIQDRKLTEAQELLVKLTDKLPDNHIELVKAKLLLRKQELRHAKN